MAFRELIKKYGKVALGVHFTVSAASVSGLYIAIKNNLDVESFLQNFHINPSPPQPPSEPIPQAQTSSSSSSSPDGFVMEETNGSPNQPTVVVEEKKLNRTAELAASTGGALALAVLCNKALFPIRVPITVALTPPIAKFLARRKITKTSIWIFLVVFKNFRKKKKEGMSWYSIKFISLLLLLFMCLCWLEKWEMDNRMHGFFLRCGIGFKF